MAALSDMGGRAEYYGPIEREPNEPVFHARWEARTFGISSFLLPLFGGNADAFRRAMEQLSREVYMSGYYQRWMAAFEQMLVRAATSGPTSSTRSSKAAPPLPPLAAARACASC